LRIISDSAIQAAFYFVGRAELNPNEAGDGYFPAGIDAGNGYQQRVLRIKETLRSPELFR
jgi:hypothetical protein